MALDLKNLSPEANKFLKALLAEGVQLKDEVLHRIFRRVDNPAGCEKCGARTKLAAENAAGALVTTCCGDVVIPAPKKDK
jgi:hypothetical protein